MVDEKIPYIFYLYLHSKLWEMTKGEIISEKDLKTMLFQWKIPKTIRPLIVKEMELLGLLKEEGRRLIKLNRPTFNEDKVNEYYELLNIF